MTRRCSCPECGGLSNNPRIISVGDIANVDFIDVNLAANRGFGMDDDEEPTELSFGAAGPMTTTFTFFGEDDLDWSAENERLNATLTCSDCDYTWPQAATKPKTRPTAPTTAAA